MKKILLLLPLLLFSGYTYFTDVYPVFMNRADLEASIHLVNDSTLDFYNPGRIYVYQNWLLVVETYAGVHLIDNTNPAHPVRKGFLRVPGCENLTVGNGILYVNNAVDLVGVRIDFNRFEATEVARNRMVLPEIQSPEGYLPWEYRRGRRARDTEIIGWKFQKHEN